MTIAREMVCSLRISSCFERRAGNEAAQTTQAAEGAKRNKAGKAVHGVSVMFVIQNSVGRIKPTAIPSSANSALPACTKMFS